MDSLVRDALDSGTEFYDGSTAYEVTEYQIENFLWGSYYHGPKSGKVDILTNYIGYKKILPYLHNNRHFLELFNIKYTDAFDVENTGLNAAVFADNNLIGVLRNI